MQEINTTSKEAKNKELLASFAKIAVQNFTDIKKNLVDIVNGKLRKQHTVSVKARIYNPLGKKDTNNDLNHKCE